MREFRDIADVNFDQYDHNDSLRRKRLKNAIVRTAWLAAFSIICLLAVWAFNYASSYLHRQDARFAAIVMIHSVKPVGDDTLNMRYETNLTGSPVSLKIGTRCGNSVDIVSESVNRSRSLIDILTGDSGSPFGSHSSGEGAFVLGKCEEFELIKTPYRVEMQRGEVYVIGSCTRMNGDRAELFVSCE